MSEEIKDWTKQIPEGWVGFHHIVNGWGVHLDDDPQSKSIYVNDAVRLLQINIFGVGVDLHEVHRKLQPLLDAERAERLKKLQPVCYKRISIPLVNRVYPPLMAGIVYLLLHL